MSQLRALTRQVAEAKAKPDKAKTAEQSLYDRLGGVYAIAAVNMGESTIPLILSILIPAAVAAVIGAMMFYGRISDVYMSVITLVVTLILFKFMNATAGDAYRLGDARLGGFNGMPGFPTLNVPGLPEISLFGTPSASVSAFWMAIVPLTTSEATSAFGR